MPWKSAPADARLNPRSPDQMFLRHREEEDERDEREHQRVPAWDEQEERGRERASEEHGRVDRIEEQRAVRVPDGKQGERVGDRARLDEPLERDRERQERRAHGRRCSQDQRPRCATVDPDQQADQEERRDDKCVSLLNPVREHRGERRDDEQERDGERDPGGHKGADRRIEPPGEGGHDDERGEGQDAEVEIELREVVQEEARDLIELIVAVADDRVGAEEIRERATSRSLPGHHEQAHSCDHGVEGEEGPQARAQRLLLEQREQERREEDRGHERHRLYTRAEGDRDQREQDCLSGRRRPLEDEHEHERDGEEEWVEDVLGHDRPRVDEGRHGDREQRCEERKRRFEHSPSEEVRRDRGQGHVQRIQGLDRRVGVRQVLEERVRRADQERVDDAEAAGVDVAHAEGAVRGDAACELRVDELVDHDERRHHPPGEPRPHEERAGDDRGEPAPRRHSPHKSL